MRMTTSDQLVEVPPGKKIEPITVGELELPAWVGKADMGATLEALGNLYAARGDVEYAMPLYLQSISLLVPPPSSGKPEPGSSDKCHAATIVSVPSMTPESR